MHLNFINRVPRIVKSNTLDRVNVESLNTAQKWLGCEVKFCEMAKGSIAHEMSFVKV